MRHALYASPWLARLPLFSPPGEFGGGGEGDDTFLNDIGDLDLGGDSDVEDELGLGDLGDDAEDDGLGGDDDSENDGTITDDFTSALGELFGTKPSKGGAGANQTQNQSQNQNGNGGGNGNGNGGGNEPTPQEVQEALAAQINEGISKLSLPETIIPDDFNPSDPKQLRTVLNAVQQQGARAAIALMMTPMQVGLGSLAKQLRREMAATAGSATEDATTTRLLTAHVPAYRNPTMRPMVDLVLSKAKERFPGNPQGQVRLVRKLMAGMGGSSGSNAPRGNNNRRSQSSESSLDLYAPVGNRGQNTRQTQKPTRAQRALAKALGIPI